MKQLGVITRAGLATENFPINCYLIIYDSFDVSWRPDKQINKSIVRLWYCLPPYHQLLDFATFIFTLVKFTVAQRVSAGLVVMHQLQSRKCFTPELDETHALEWHSSEAQSEFCLTHRVKTQKYLWKESSHSNCFCAISFPTCTLQMCLESTNDALFLFPLLFRTTHMLNWSQTHHAVDTVQLNEYCKSQITQDYILGNTFSLFSHWVDRGWTSCAFWVDFCLGSNDTSDFRSWSGSSESQLCSPQRMPGMQHLNPSSNQSILLWTHKIQGLKIPFQYWHSMKKLPISQRVLQDRFPTIPPFLLLYVCHPWSLQLQAPFFFAACQHEQLMAPKSCSEWPV